VEHLAITYNLLRRYQETYDLLANNQERAEISLAMLLFDACDELKRYDEAAAVLQASLAHNPDSPKLLENLICAIHSPEGYDECSGSPAPAAARRSQPSQARTLCAGHKATLATIGRVG
jgi:hypothetical protein